MKVDATSAATKDDALMALYHNRANFNLAAHKTWLETKGDKIKSVAEKRPPTQIYTMTHHPYLECSVAGYSPDGRCLAQDLSGNIYLVPPEYLKDITDQVRDRYKLK